MATNRLLSISGIALSMEEPMTESLAVLIELMLPFVIMMATPENIKNTGVSMAIRLIVLKRKARFIPSAPSKVKDTEYLLVLMTHTLYSICLTTLVVEATVT